MILCEKLFFGGHLLYNWAENPASLRCLENNFMTSSPIFLFFYVLEKLKKRFFGGHLLYNWAENPASLRRVRELAAGSFVSRQLATVRPPRNPFCLFFLFSGLISFIQGFGILVGGGARKKSCDFILGKLSLAL